MTKIETEVLVIGGGLAGLTLAGVLGAAGVGVICLDRSAPQTQATARYDGRTTAISFASHRVLQAAGVWDKIKKYAAPILDIRVAEGSAPLFLHFSAQEENMPFGWIVKNTLLRQLLFENLSRFKDNVRHLAPVEISAFFENGSAAGVLLKDGRKISAQLMIGADGRNSSVRDWLGIDVSTRSYAQSAIVCNVAHAHDHESAAVEHFLPAGPFAILPMTRGTNGAHRSSVVWTVETNAAQNILSAPPDALDETLQGLFGTHLGRVHHVSAPMCYPLSLMHAKTYIGARTALMAEAAHVIHPIAGQGLNLSMRDVAVLAEIVVDRLRLGLDIGSPVALKDYENMRRPDTLLMAGFTDLLNRLFSNDLSTLGLTRAAGLGIVEKIPFLKAFFAKQAMGLGGKGGRILQGLPL